MLTPKITNILQVEGLASTVTDVAGDYSSTNTGGWNAPNPARSDVSAASLILTPIDLITLEQGAALPAIDIFARGYPNTPVLLLPTDYGNSDDTTSITDGVWQNDLTVTCNTVFGEQLFTYTWYTFATEQSKCCYYNKVAVKSCCCNGTNGLINKMKMKIDIDLAAWNELYCQNVSNAAAAISEMKSICNNATVCKNCGGCC